MRGGFFGGRSETLSVPAQNRGRVLLVMNGASGGRIRAMAGVKKPRLVVVDKDRSGWNTPSSYLLRRTGTGILDATFGVEGFATRFVTLF